MSSLENAQDGMMSEEKMQSVGDEADGNEGDEGRAPEERAARRREKRDQKARRANFKRLGLVRALRELVLSVAELRDWPRPADQDLQGLSPDRFTAPVLVSQFVTGPRFEAYDRAELWDALVEQMEAQHTMQRAPVFQLRSETFESLRSLQAFTAGLCGSVTSLAHT